MSSFAHLVGSSAKSKAALPAKVAAAKPAAKANKKPRFDHLLAMAPAFAAAAVESQAVDHAAGEKATAKKLARRISAAAARGVR
jgi:hypothetical protein